MAAAGGRVASIINKLAKNHPGQTVSESAKHDPDGVNNQHSDCDRTPAMHEESSGEAGSLCLNTAFILVASFIDIPSGP